jgi:hypothetical protein
MNTNKGYIIFTQHDGDEISAYFLPLNKHSTKFFNIIRKSDSRAQHGNPRDWLNIIDVIEDGMDEKEIRFILKDYETLDLYEQIEDWSFTKYIKVWWIQTYCTNEVWIGNDKEIISTYFMDVF